MTIPGKYFVPFFIYAALLLFPNASAVHAQSKGILRGLVTDSSSSESLAFASVFIEELKTGALTDSKGYFIITSIPADKHYTLAVSYTGYIPKKINFSVSSAKMTHVDIRLSSSSIYLPTIEKIEKRFTSENSTDISLQRLNIRDLELLPKGVETDIIRSLHYLPGVRSTGDVSARYYIRGGASNQNLVQINGAAIYNPFHALGLFSVVDPEIVNSAEFYKGGFPAEYSGRLSSVLNLSIKDGNKNSYSGKVSGSYLTAKGLIEGPIPDGSFILAGRKSFFSSIYKKFINKNLPLDFYDLAFRVNYSNPDFVEGSKIIIHGFSSGDEVNNSISTDPDLKWSNSVLGFTWFQISDSPLFFEVGLSFSNFNGEIIPNSGTTRNKKNQVKDANLKMDVHYVYDSKDELGVGLNVIDLNASLKMQNAAGAGTDLSLYGTNFSFYAKYKFLRFKNFGLEAGAHINLAGLSREGGGFFTEPRLSFTYRIIPEIALKGAWGIFQQELTTLSDENELVSLFEPWIIAPSYIGPARSTHSIFGIQASLGTSVSAELEGYYKKSTNLAYINDRKIFAADRDFVAGTGESYGLESTLKFELGPFNIAAAYTLGWSYDNVRKWLFYPRYDARHSLNLTADLNLGRSWQIGAVWVYNTGMAYTKTAGYYDKMVISDIFTFADQGNSFAPFMMLADKNLGRLPDYHRLDISLSKKISTRFFNMYLDFSALNVYNRKNVFYFERETGTRVNMLPFLPTATVKIEI